VIGYFGEPVTIPIMDLFGYQDDIDGTISGAFNFPERMRTQGREIKVSVDSGDSE
jgi:hypothetical protein